MVPEFLGRVSNTFFRNSIKRVRQDFSNFNPLFRFFTCRYYCMLSFDVCFSFLCPFVDDNCSVTLSKLLWIHEQKVRGSAAQL